MQFVIHANPELAQKLELYGYEFDQNHTLKLDHIKHVCDLAVAIREFSKLIFPFDHIQQDIQQQSLHIHL